MNQHFNLTRFGRLLRKHTAEHLPSYAMGTAVLAGGVLVVLGSLTYLSHRPLERELQLILFLFGLLAAGAVFTSSAFAAVGTPRSAAPALLLPASHLEKYLVAWLWSLPVFMVVYTAVFVPINLLVLQIGNQGRPYEVYDFARGAREWLTPLLSYVLLHSVALWGAIYFQRLQVIKTAFLLFGSLVGLTVLNMRVLKAMVPATGITLPFNSMWVGQNELHVPLTLPEHQQQLVLLVLPLVLATLLWLAAYARLTEKQI
jgi:hypothetical protein